MQGILSRRILPAHFSIFTLLQGESLLLPPEEPGPEICFVPGECVGPLVGTTFEANAAACRATCKSYGPEPPPPPVPAHGRRAAALPPGMCEWFTFHPSDGLCVLYERCELDIDSCPSCVSGISTLTRNL